MMLAGIVACAELPNETESSKMEGGDTTEVGSVDKEQSDSEIKADDETDTCLYDSEQNEETDTSASSASETVCATDGESLTESDSEGGSHSLSESEATTESITDSEDLSESEEDSRGETLPNTEISKIEGGAAVVTKNGLEYTATGFISEKKSHFIIKDGLEITFADGLFSDKFNRLTFNYETAAPIRLFITYTLGDAEKTDYFFLEAGKSSFRGLIEGYLAKKEGVALKKITVDTCESVEASFILHDVNTELIPVIKDDLTVENDRYKIGVRLSWGGAMTYFEDKLDGDDTLGNLVNIHDTGRLIQQSFYGTYTNNDGYVSVPNGDRDGATLWPYNPVQGGDRKNNGSDRLIDVEYDEEKDYIYIVTQPLDWAYVKGKAYETEYKGLTYTYYENTYRIVEGDEEGTEDDYVLVDNVATDFSGWKHEVGGQEIPAVYLVSYFDTFSYYNGFKPWTDDAEGVLYERELMGWENSGSFPLYKGNDETWSIWINTESGFGFGTYCPNIQKHIAIRHQYDGSKNPMANSTSYVAPSCSIMMQSYKPIKYSYILATGDPEEIRAVFKENKDFTDNPSLSEDRQDILVSPQKFDMTDMDFTVKSNADIFNSPKNLDIGFDSVENALKLYVTAGRDPFATLNFGLNSDKVISFPEDFNTIDIEYMLPVTNSKSSDTLVLFISSGAEDDFEEKNTVSGTIVRDGEYHKLSIKVPNTIRNGELHRIRFDAFTFAAVGDVMYIKRISLSKQDYPELGITNTFDYEGCERLAATTNATNAYFDKVENALALKVHGGTDVSVTFDFKDLGLNTGEYTRLTVEYMMPAVNSKNCSAAIYFTTSDNSSLNGSKRVSAKGLVADGEYHTMVFDFTQIAEYWTGEILRLRFDYFENTPDAGDVMYIRSFKLEKVGGFDVGLTEDENGEIFSKVHYTNAYYDESEGAVALEAVGGDNKDVNVVMDMREYNLDTADYSRLFICYKVPTNNSKQSYSCTVYFITDVNSSYDEKQAVYGKLTVDGQYHTLEIVLSDKATWTGSIVALRLDYFQSDSCEGDLIYIESIYLK